MERIARWWHEHASSPDVFLDELEQAITHIETTALLGTVYDAGAQRPVYRRLMKKSGYHIYLVQRSKNVVVIVSVWGARRRRGPKLE